MKILVVEDSRTQAESLRYILEKKGHTVTVAANGRDALGQIAAGRPDIVLTDIMMPEMDGYELCRRIKTDDALKSIPVIIVTQLFDPVDVVRGLEAGADNFIIKPFEQKDIEARIQEVMATQTGDDVTCYPLEVRLADGSHTLTAGRRQILNILLSTYEITVRKNAELQEAHERLNLQSDQLQQAVADQKKANRDLQAENAERVKAEKALAEANKKLQLMASITRHDLRNQLTAMREYLELSLARREKDPASAWTDVSNAMDIVNQTINTVEFTGEYQKIGVKSPVWKNARHLVDDTGKYITLGRIRLENAIPSAVEIYADPLIEKVFFNLIDNAVRYGKKTTTIRFRYEENESGGTIICEDDGIGIADEEKEKIFAYEYGMNTGLGLFLTREVLTITGIVIRETGIPGKGAKFEMKCPKGAIRIKP
ncbi:MULTISPECIES: hybrid sensor histidine kinase/response regulator [unclassified Methanoregula]|uniref:hybrid sensor histidine kinase/response regulator n=1 Tax=unclassified Methanoregula TaxID=2649730 RepID=UPI0009C462F8|nr:MULTISPECIES: hybrid sensor histidine kinase/response regulator [unclassified Methanoregula]OPX62968.1 MAG: response regulator PleD [Methanoregula sp. PtaB.Bin085]OPY35181.1 MAG: response regulator PleD [Methanoregula sp. PtaU1.Bin006]